MDMALLSHFLCRIQSYECDSGTVGAPNYIFEAMLFGTSKDLVQCSGHSRCMRSVSCTGDTGYPRRGRWCPACC